MAFISKVAIPIPEAAPEPARPIKWVIILPKMQKKLSFTKRLIYKVSMYMFSYYEGVNLSEGQDYVTNHCQVYRVFILQDKSGAQTGGMRSHPLDTITNTDS